jgi:hypothetical protein
MTVHRTDYPDPGGLKLASVDKECAEEGLNRYERDSCREPI